METELPKPSFASPSLASSLTSSPTEWSTVTAPPPVVVATVPTSSTPVLFTLLAAAWLLPNTYELMVRYRPALITYPEHEAALRRALDRRHWRPRPAWAVGLATGFVAAFISLHREQVFLYFQF